MRKIRKIRLIFLLALAAASAHSAKAEKIKFQNSEGIEFAGNFTKPHDPLQYTLILLHGLGSSKEEWDGFYKLLASKGFGVLVYDARGHGETKKKVSGEPIDYQLFYGQGLKSDWGKMIGDLGAARQYLEKKCKIAPHTVAVGGASIGANIALRYASEHPEVPFVVLLSPGMNYQGITTSDVAEKFSDRPLLMAASPTDGYAFQSVLALQKRARSASVTVIQEAPGAGHGVQMFKRRKPDEPSSLETKIVQWIQNPKAPRFRD